MSNQFQSRIEKRIAEYKANQAASLIPKRQTDEAKKIERLIVHDKGIGWFISQAKAEGIDIERTYDDDPNGDMYCPEPDKMEALRALTRKLKQKYSKP